MSPRVISMPLSGGDRKHYAKELHIAESAHARLVEQLAAARLRMNLLECEEWDARQFIGGDANPSPTIAAAIDAGCIFLCVECRACRHSDRVNLTDVVWSREKEIHTLRKALICKNCRTKGPRLTGLETRRPDFEPPKAAARKR